MRRVDGGPGAEEAGTGGVRTLFTSRSGEFLERHWPDTPCSFHGGLARFGALGDLTLNEAVAAFPWWMRHAAQRRSPSDEGNYEVRRVFTAGLGGALREGCTVQIGLAHRHLPAAEQWLGRLSRDLGIPPI